MSPVRKVVPLLALLAIPGCGGDPIDGSTGPAGQVATLTIVAGDNQSAAAGAPVSVAPSVMARDQEANPVAGVVISWAVDSGVGLVQSASAATGSDGIARATGWTMGAGKSRLRASVAGGPVVMFRSTGTGTLPGVEAITGSNGGTVMVTEPTSPIKGVALTVAPGAFPSSVQWQITPSSTPFPTSQGMYPSSPMIAVTTSATEYAAHPMSITIPATVPAGTFPVIVMRDPATGAFEAIPTVKFDATSVTGMTSHFRGTFLVRKGGASLREGSTATAVNSLDIFVTSVPTTEYNHNLDTGFRPGVDDWEFPNFGTTLAPQGICAGQTLTAVWYFLRQKESGGPLNGRFKEIKVPAGSSGVLDNPHGLRWASVIQESWLDDGLTGHVGEVLDRAAELNVNPDVLLYNYLQVNMYLTGLPQFIVADHPGFDFGHALVAYRVSEGRVYLADPNLPGDLTRSVEFSNGEFQTYTMPKATLADGSPVAFTRIVPIGLATAIPLTRFDATWPQVVNGTIGKSGGYKFPLSTFDTWGQKDVQDTVWVVDDTLRIFGGCPGCLDEFDTTLDPAPTRPLYVRVYIEPKSPSTTWAPFCCITTAGDGTNVNLVIPPGSSFRAALVSFSAYSAAELNDPPREALFGPWVPRWQDFRFVRLVRRKLTVTPDKPRIPYGVPVTLGTEFDAEIPDAAKYVWEFGDGTPQVTVLNDEDVQHTYLAPAEGHRIDLNINYTVKVTLYDNRNPGAPLKLATAKTTVTAGNGVAWRMTQFTLASSTGAPPTFPGPNWEHHGLRLQAWTTSPSSGRMIWLPDGSPIPYHHSPLYNFSLYLPAVMPGAMLMLHSDGNPVPPKSLYDVTTILQAWPVMSAGSNPLNPFWAALGQRPMDIDNMLQVTGTVDEGSVLARGVMQYNNGGSGPTLKVESWIEVSGTMANGEMTGTLTYRQRWFTLWNMEITNDVTRAYTFKAKRI